MQINLRCKYILLRLLGISKSFGWDPIQTFYAFIGLLKYINNFIKLKKAIRKNSYPIYAKSITKFGSPSFSLDDFNANAGTAKGHYFNQDLLVANLIYLNKPKVHLDIGSRVDGFIAHLLSFEQKTILGDIRSLEIENPNLNFIHIDLTKPIKKSLCGKFTSVSCLHALEHMGLGRYGDPINPDGHYLAIDNLKKLVSKNGIIYLSFPCSKKSRIEYNSQRVLSLKESKMIFKEKNLVIEKFSYVDDFGNLVNLKKLDEIDWESSFNLINGCAIWVLKKV